MSTYELVKKSIAEQLDIDPEKITPETKLVEDLKADSIDFISLIMELEQATNLNMADNEEDLYKLKTVGDIAAYVDSLE